MRNVRKNWEMKLNNTKKEEIVWCQNQIIIAKNFLVIEMRKAQLFINKPVYLGLSILELRKIVMYEFWYGYVKPKY